MNILNRLCQIIKFRRKTVNPSNDDNFEFVEKKLVGNPQGPYKLQLTYKGIKCSIQIKHINEIEFDVRIRTDKKITPTELQGLKEYLEAEGFTTQALKHNLFW